MTRSTRLVDLVSLAVLITIGGSNGCQGNSPPGGPTTGNGGGITADAGPPSRGPSHDSGGGVVIVEGPDGAVADDGGATIAACPDGVRGNDIPCDPTVDVICVSDCMNDSRIRCGCTTRGQDDRWVCGGQPQSCQ
jgi:hypothetical protein